MNTRYERVDGVLHSREAWVRGRTITEHWGVVGDQGETKTRRLPAEAGPDAAVAQVLEKAMAEGYVGVEEIGEKTLVIEYAADGFGWVEDLDKRHAPGERMNDILGWAGMGYCDGGSIGAGTMEVFCYLVDFEIAKRVVAADLADTEFGDYTRILCSEDEEGAADEERRAS